MPLGSFIRYNRTAGHLDPIITHEETFTSSGTFVVPADVTEISVVCVGGGGGGFGTTTGGGGGAGGDLRWRIKLPVTPGETLNVTVGAGGAGGLVGTPAQPGGVTGIYRSSTPLLVAAGGAAGSDADNNAPSLPPQRAQNGTSTTISLPLIGGGLGGRGGWEELGQQAGGGGGAAGYSGPGGSGGHADEAVIFRGLFPGAPGNNVDPGYNGSGGGGAGGTAGGVSKAAGGGGGVGIFGQGASGRSYYTRLGTSYPSSLEGTVGEGGSPITPGIERTLNGRIYGGGGGGTQTSARGGAGAQGAVRIIWGRNRYFPAANTGRIERFPKSTEVAAAPTLLNFITPGFYNWIVPDGVTSINVFAVGAGGGANTGNVNTKFASAGGGGGATSFGNNISVTPGETLLVTVGLGGASVTSLEDDSEISGGPGGFSGITRGTTTLISAGGGGGGMSGWDNDTGDIFAGGAGGVSSGTACTSGFNGGAGGSAIPPGESGIWGGAGGGGAGGYLGPGGAGANASALGSPGNSAAPNSGGGGGGGSAINASGAGGGGGGIGLPYISPTNNKVLLRTSGTGAGGSADTGGFGGSGGSRGNFNQATGGSHIGGNYGGGAGAGGDSSRGKGYLTSGAPGAVQITYGGVDPYPGTAV